MDSIAKKRKADENGIVSADAASGSMLTPEDARKIIESFTQEQLLDIVQDAATRHLDVLEDVRSIADRDPAQRKLFVRGLGWETTTDALRTLFSQYGELEEAIVILDKATGKSKGYGFVTFKHIDGALLALKEPSKKIDGRMSVTQLAASGTSGPTANITPVDVLARKIFVGNVPADVSADRLLSHFSSYGEIEEGPLGFDKQTGKFRGFAMFVYKTAEAARASLVDPNKVIDGHMMVCKLATDGKKAKPGVPTAGAGGIQAPSGIPGDVAGEGLGLAPPSSMPSSLTSQYGRPGLPAPSLVPTSLTSQYGGPGGISSYGGFSGNQGPPSVGHHHHPLNSPLQTSIGGASGLSSVGGQVPSSLGSGGVYGSGLSGPYGASQYGGPASGGYGGLSGGGSSFYRLPPSSDGTSSGGYPEGGNYGLSSTPYAGQQPLLGASAAPRVPPGGGMHQSLPPYY